MPSLREYPRVFFSVVCLATSLLAGATLAQAGTVSVKFTGRGSAMGPAEVAGVAPKANWNNAPGSSGTLALVDESGAPTGATVTWSAESTWSVPIIDSPGNYRMMLGYLDALGNTPTTVTVSNLPASAGGYTVYVYADGANVSSVRTGAYQVSGPGTPASTINITDASYADFSGSFTQSTGGAGNYAVFPVNGTSFTLTAAPFASSDAWRRAPVNAVQIVPAGSGGPADFVLTAAPATQSVTPGNGTSYTVTVTPLNGFAGTVGLSLGGLPSGAQAAFAPPSVTGAGSATLTLSTAANTPTGNFTLTVTGTSGSLSHTTGITLAVSPTPPAPQSRAMGINFTGRASAMAAAEVAGVVPKANWNNAAGAASTAPLPLLDETGAASGATATWFSEGVWSLPIPDAPGNSRMMGGYLDALGGTPTSVSVAGLAAGTYDIYAYIDGDNSTSSRTGRYQLGGTSVNAIDAAGSNFTGAFVQANNSAGNYIRFTTTGTGFTLIATPVSSGSAYLRAPVNGIQIVPTGPPVPDFTVAASPASQPAAPGAAAPYTVTVTALNGFTGSVALSAAGLPAGAGATFSPAYVNGAGSSTLTVTNGLATPGGSYTITVTGASGSLSRQATATLVVPDYTVAVTPALQSAAPGASVPYTVTVAGQNGFAGTVALSVSGLPAGAGAVFSPPSVTGSGTATLTVTPASGTPPGNSNFTVTGTSGVLARSGGATLAVTAPPSTQAAAIGINFVGRGTSMGASETAGVLPRNNWNNALGASNASPLALRDEFGNATGATATWASDLVWSTPIADAPGNARLMNGYLDTSGGPITVTVAGLAPSATGYNVYVYSDGDNGSYARTGSYQITGTPAVTATDPAGVNFSGAFAQANNSAGNYVVFTTTLTGFTLTATPLSSNGPYLRAPVNAIQIVPAAQVGPPDFTLAAGPSTRQITPGSSAAYTVTLTPQNAFTGTITLGVTGLPAGATAAFAPPSLAGGGSSTLTVQTAAGGPTGTFSLTITGSSGSLSHAGGVNLAVNPSSALLSGSLSTPTGVQNLTALGLLDWAQWGYQFNSNYDHKAGITPQISNWTVINGEPGQVGSYTTASSFTFAWSDGAPDRGATTQDGIRLTGLGRGLQISAPADTSTRTLTVYVGAWNTQGKMVAHLTDASAPDYVDTSLDSSSAVWGAYTFTYRAASPGQRLVVTMFQNDNTRPRCDEAFGVHCAVLMQAATLR